MERDNEGGSRGVEGIRDGEELGHLHNNDNQPGVSSAAKVRCGTMVCP
jgi:hypothetical protein